MKFKSDLNLGIFVGVVFATVIFLILSAVAAIDGKVILYTLIICCLIDFMLFVTFRHMDKQDSKHAQELQKNAEAECQRLKAMADTFGKKVIDFKDAYEKFSRKFLIDSEIQAVLKSYALVMVYANSIGKIRYGLKEEALRQITEAEQKLKAMIYDPSKEAEKINIALNEKKITFDKMVKNFDHRKPLPTKIFHKQCGNELVCLHCSYVVERGDFEYRS
ncbi:MAG: hypothetical protein GX642_14335 [Smithella sp.]|nr:hypothetical protein [Smithella sp.]